MLYENTTFFTDQYLTFTINIGKDVYFNSDWSSSFFPFFFFFFFLNSFFSFFLSFFSCLFQLGKLLQKFVRNTVCRHLLKSHNNSKMLQFNRLNRADGKST